MQKNLTIWWKELVSRAKCKLTLSRLDYPHCILPKNHYTNRLNIDDLAAIENCCIVRRSDKTIEETFTEADTLREDVISESEMPGLSMNLLGSKFKVKHLPYRCTGQAMELWNKPEETTLKQYEGNYNRLSLATPVFLPLKSIHNKTYPYYRADDNTGKKYLQSLNITPKVSEDGKLECKGTAYVKHAPNKLNYWHVEYALETEKKEEVKNTKSAFAKSAAKFAYNNIICFEAKKSVNRISKIPCKSYLKVA